MQKWRRGALGVIVLVFVFVAYSLLLGTFSPSSAPVREGAAVPRVDNVSRTAVLKVPVKSNRDAKAGEDLVVLNDPFIKEKWGIKKTETHKAWNVSQGSKSILVAVIDTGADVHHRDLDCNIWKNPGEQGVVQTAECLSFAKKKQTLPKKCDKATNGVDDDGNGLIDDVYGWNYVANSGDVSDYHGHGTHIAGIIGACGGNNFGIIGVAPKVSLMILKYYDQRFPGTNLLRNTVRSIRYAIEKKADIINYSGGGVEFSSEEYDAIKEAEKKGILFIAAAGNLSSNSDDPSKRYYPADYGLSNIISVTAINDLETKVLPSSNYGTSTVDIAAPGENIYSTMPGSVFGELTGTSQATAFVTGVAVLVKAHRPSFSAADIKKYILQTGDEYPSLISKTRTARVLNSYKALTSLDRGILIPGTAVANGLALNPVLPTGEAEMRPQPTALSPEEGPQSAEGLANFGRILMKALRRPTPRVGAGERVPSRVEPESDSASEHHDIDPHPPREPGSVNEDQ